MHEPVTAGKKRYRPAHRSPAYELASFKFGAADPSLQCLQKQRRHHYHNSHGHSRKGTSQSRCRGLWRKPAALTSIRDVVHSRGDLENGAIGLVVIIYEEEVGWTRPIRCKFRISVSIKHVAHKEERRIRS